MYSRVKPLNLRSSTLTTSRYLLSFGSLAVYSFSTCPATIWESILMTRFLAPRAFALLRPKMSPSYSAILLVAWNSSLAAYFERRPEGAWITAEAPAPRLP
jgi:hypothetical protein